MLAGLRPGTNAEEGPGLTVTKPGSGSWLKMEFDCEGLRRLLGKVRAARRAGSGARGPWGRFHPWQGYLAVFPPPILGLGAAKPAAFTWIAPPL